MSDKRRTKRTENEQNNGIQFSPAFFDCLASKAKAVFFKAELQLPTEFLQAELKLPTYKHKSRALAPNCFYKQSLSSFPIFLEL